MKNTINIKSSGIPVIDENWGGFYSGSTYLINGQPKSGKTSTALKYAYNIASKGEVCVFFTNVRPRKLIINAYSQGLNIQPLIDDNKLIVVRMTSPNIERIQQEKDAYLSEFLYDIIKVADEFKPNTIVFDELTPYLNFSDKELFLQVFNEVVETLEDSLITTVFINREATSTDELYLAKHLEDIVNGVINLDNQNIRQMPTESKDAIPVVPSNVHLFANEIFSRSAKQVGAHPDHNDCYEHATATNLLFTDKPDNYYESDQFLKSNNAY